MRYSDRFRDNVFRTLYEAKEYAHKNQYFALKWDMGKLKITHWRENDNLVQYLIDNLATKFHSWALRVESFFGDNQGLSMKIKKLLKVWLEKLLNHTWGSPMYVQSMNMHMQPMGFATPTKGFSGATEE